MNESREPAVSLLQQHGGKLATLDRGLADLIADRQQRTRWVEPID